MKLKLLDQTCQIVKLPVDAAIPQELADCAFFSVTKTRDELSLVVPETVSINSPHIEKGWKVLKVEAMLDFGLVGVISKISAILADHNIPVFVLSTYNTDYILAKESHLEKTVLALAGSGYEIEV